MQAKLITTPLGKYVQVQWSGSNESGITPVGDRVLILPDGVDDAGLIALPPELAERMQQAAETGVLVSAGQDAWQWNSDRSRKYEGTKPDIGQRVIFERYAGSFQQGADGRRYRLMDDKCIGGLFEFADAKTTDQTWQERAQASTDALVMATKKLRSA